MNKGAEFFFTTELLRACILLTCAVGLTAETQRAQFHRLLSPGTLFLPQIVLED